MFLSFFFGHVTAFFVFFWSFGALLPLAFWKKLSSISSRRHIKETRD